MLTELRCRSAKPASKPYKLGDSKGLYLYVSTTGHRSWRWKYRVDRKEKRLTFGPYPDVSLKQARELRDEAARILRAGRDPGEERRRAPAAEENCLEAVARRWHARQKALWSARYARLVLRRLAADVFPAIGSKPIGDVTARDVRDLLDVVQGRGAIEAAHRIRADISAIYDSAIGEGLVDNDPAAGRQKALAPVRKSRRAAMLKLERARAFLRAAEALPAHPSTRLASRLLAITAVRPGVVRFTPRTSEFEWGMFEGGAPLWRIPPERMKLDVEQKEDEAFEFLVPLPWQALDVIRAAAAFAGGSPWLFPSQQFWRRPMSENALSSFYRRVPPELGRHVPHGWRSSFSTIMNERAVEQERPGDRPIIDLMLAHKPQGVEAAYNRAAYMGRRRELAQEWADMLLEGFPPAEQLLEGPRK
jgi:hypothetical protein